MPSPESDKRDSPHDVFDKMPHDLDNPDPWLALYLDDSIPFDTQAKTALLTGNYSYSRRFLLPAIRPLIFVIHLLVIVTRRFFPRWPASSMTLHRLIVKGLNIFATPEANLLILRHFNIGTELLDFIRDNVHDVEAETVPLRPTTLADLKDNVFLQHDLNIYNFIIGLNKQLREQGKAIMPVETVDYSSISEDGFQIEPLPCKWHNFIDVQTAIEFYTPIYALFLPRHDFVRAVNSLQLDETIGIYIARILGAGDHLSFINNHHPMIPLSTFRASFRLMMHGYDAEAMHGYLREMRKATSALTSPRT